MQGAHVISHSDFTQKQTHDKIRDLLNGRTVDCVLSDMAPNATGVRCLDQEKIMELCYNVLQFAIHMSSDNASLLVKIWDNGDSKKFIDIAKRYYNIVKYIKPEASRSDSAENYILAKEFKGLKNISGKN